MNRDGLDYANRRNVLEFIEFIGSRTATNLIYVTHHKEEIPPSITHALVLDKGKIAAIGERKEVLQSLISEAR
jgi:ABC-type molybdenum transport system ATPase subunit/photorepair protein PhrA